MSVKSFLARAARRVLTATGGGMVAIGDDWLTISVGAGVVLLELSGRELVETLRARRARRELELEREIKGRARNGSR